MPGRPLLGLPTRAHHEQRLAVTRDLELPDALALRPAGVGEQVDRRDVPVVRSATRTPAVVLRCPR